MDVYFSADAETDGPIPGPYSLLSFALVYAGRFDGVRYERPDRFDDRSRLLYRELKPISDKFDPEALQINRLDRNLLVREGADPESAMTEACRWVRSIAGTDRPILVAYPLSFDWTWLYWYFMRFSKDGSPFNHSGCFDLKTAYAVKAGTMISAAGRSQVEASLRPTRNHTHHALEDAIEQAELFANLMEWGGERRGSASGPTR